MRLRDWELLAGSNTVHGLFGMIWPHSIEIGAFAAVAILAAVLIAAVSLFAKSAAGRRRADEKFRGLLESAPDAMVIVNSAGEIVLINSQTEKVFGYPRRELLGKNMDILVPHRFRDLHSRHRNGYFTEPRVRAMGVGLELFGVRKNGDEFPVEISLSPLTTEEGVLVSSSIRDITDRKRFETALREKNLELENANRAKDTFLASMSHELRTPLNAILGFTSTLLMKLPGPLTPDQEKQLQTVRSSGRHLLSIINDLLDLARIESGRVEISEEEVHCGDAVAAVVDFIRIAAEEKGITVVVDVPDEIVVRTDARALHQILLNLANNAVKFTAAGSVTFRVRTTERPEGRVTGFSGIEFSVIDTGIGIRPEDQTRIFQAFSQVDSSHKRSYGGAGLGLHVSRRLAEILGGSITFDSEVGKGSTFRLTLPRR
ncbi:MAG TPA: ATP-binding protein [Bryobacteraceae bacterium]|jgi:protein-histidine pros-kinase|nr:ATP-binding protein [Bryobacteraceae bacterium]